jgi:hypothetical protein
MLPPEEIAQIKAEIKRLEELCKASGDRAILERIGVWIKAEKKKLDSDQPTH